MANTPYNLDYPSRTGQFGWERIGQEDFAVPVIVRANNIRYSPVKIVEQEIIKKYSNLPQSVFQCIHLKSFYMTSYEAKLINLINIDHCNHRYGEYFYNSKDVVISASDVKDLSRFLNVSTAIFSNDLHKVSANFGVIKLYKDLSNPSDYLFVPYITKSYQDKPVRFVPTVLIDSFATKSRQSVRGTSTEWDIMYLKMLCIYCDNRMEHFLKTDCQIILLDGLLYTQTGDPIIYEEYKNMMNAHEPN